MKDFFADRLLSRRRLLASGGLLAGAVIASVPGAVSALAPARAQIKQPKAAVDYRNRPRDGKRCADCRFFIDGGKCRFVEGDISPDGWCQLWQAA